jgi:hypothetical protein
MDVAGGGNGISYRMSTTDTSGALCSKRDKLFSFLANIIAFENLNIENL